MPEKNYLGLLSFEAPLILVLQARKVVAAALPALEIS
jgi:hypothetical protein